MSFKTTLSFLLILCLLIGNGKEVDTLVHSIDSRADLMTCSPNKIVAQPLHVQMSQFFSGLFSVEEWPPRWYCGNWSSFHGWFSIMSDLMVWLSYFAIPAILYFFLFRKKVPGEFKQILRLFIAFILLCGLTHLMDVIIFWWPAYRLDTLMSFLTSLVSMGTVIALVRVMPEALKFRSPDEANQLIEELRISQEKLTKSEARFKQLLESTPDAMVIVDESGEIVFINAQTERLFGYTKEEIYGKKVEILMPDKMIHTHHQYRKNYYQKPKTRMMGEGRELLGTRKNGKNFPVEISLNPIKTGEETLVAAGIRDITKQKKAENTIRKLNQSLEKKVEERTHKLMDKTVELERKNKEMEQFAFLASHDLKAPLTNIESLVNILEMKQLILSEGEPIVEKLHQTILDSKDKLASINYIMSMKKEEKVIQEKCNIKKALDHVVNSIEDLIISSNTTIKSRIDGTENVSFPFVYMQTILQNLISNAIKYKDNERDPIIEITSSVKDEYQCLEIKDNGRGIDLEVYGKKLFGLFQRFDLDVEGKGIGLYITKSIIENYGGKITVESNLGKGTSFIIHFPLK